MTRVAVVTGRATVGDHPGQPLTARTLFIGADHQA